jgi:hypothetical protein
LDAHGGSVISNVVAVVDIEDTSAIFRRTFSGKFFGYFFVPNPKTSEARMSPIATVYLFVEVIINSEKLVEVRAITSFIFFFEIENVSAWRNRLPSAWYIAERRKLAWSTFQLKLIVRAFRFDSDCAYLVAGYFFVQTVKRLLGAHLNGYYESEDYTNEPHKLFIIFNKKYKYES